MNNTRKFKLGDLVKGLETWYGRRSYLDRRFVRNFGVIVGYDHYLESLYLVQFPFGTYTMQERDLVLISERGENLTSE